MTAASAITRRTPERTCVGCRATRPKRELVRLVLPAEPAGAPATVDPTGRRNGRGAYVCGQTAVACLILTRRRGALARALHTTPERVDIDALTAELEARGIAVGPAVPQEVSSSPR